MCWDLSLLISDILCIFCRIFKSSSSSTNIYLYGITVSQKAIASRNTKITRAEAVFKSSYAPTYTVQLASLAQAHSPIHTAREVLLTNKRPADQQQQQQQQQQNGKGLGLMLTTATSWSIWNKKDLFSITVTVQTGIQYNSRSSKYKPKFQFV